MIYSKSLSFVFSWEECWRVNQTIGRNDGEKCSNGKTCRRTWTRKVEGEKNNEKEATTGVGIMVLTL